MCPNYLLLSTCKPQNSVVGGGYRAARQRQQRIEVLTLEVRRRRSCPAALILKSSKLRVKSSSGVRWRRGARKQRRGIDRVVWSSRNGRWGTGKYLLDTMAGLPNACSENLRRMIGPGIPALFRTVQEILVRRVLEHLRPNQTHPRRRRSQAGYPILRSRTKSSFLLGTGLPRRLASNFG